MPSDSASLDVVSLDTATAAVGALPPGRVEPPRDSDLSDAVETRQVTLSLLTLPEDQSLIHGLEHLCINTQ